MQMALRLLANWSHSILNQDLSYLSTQTRRELVFLTFVAFSRSWLSLSASVLKIIMNSSWLRDALSELDPSCDKITFVGNPSSSAPQRISANKTPKPLFRISATGTLGSSEVKFTYRGACSLMD
jgi:hypothetical protein